MQGIEKKTTLTIEHDGKTGEFTFRRRTIADMGTISAKLSQMTGGTPIVDEGIGNVLRAWSELFVAMEHYPEWWIHDEKIMDDTGMLFTVFSKYCDWRDGFRGRKQREPDAAPNTPDTDTASQKESGK